MKCKVQKAKLFGSIICPTNKSYTHRALFLASLANGKSMIKNALKSSDTLATIDACKSFGAEIKEAGSNLAVTRTADTGLHGSIIDALNSGTTIRIAAAIAALSEDKTVLSGDKSLRKRPMQILLEALESLGASCSSTNGRPPITVKGKIQGGEVTISGEVSSQFVSALMIVAPKTEKGIVLNIKGDLVSKPYINATIASMKKFGVNVENITPYAKYRIPKQDYKPTNFTIPSDFSSLALLLSASVLLGDNLSISVSLGDLPQADEIITDYLEKLGVRVNLDKKILTIHSPERLHGGKFDLSNTPDLLPPLSILALKTSKRIELYNVKHARLKESDRIAILTTELKKLGIQVEEKKDGMILEPPKNLTGAYLKSHGDHRLFMAFCIAAMYVGNCTVSDPESVGVSYPNFIEDMNRVGAKIVVS
ncbi:MAG: 3-phosphoshikimate 1-carboxyvinyltransferase [Nitrosopumilaceae archaeon]